MSASSGSFGVGRDTIEFVPRQAGQAEMQRLLATSLIHEEDWDAVPAAARDELARCSDVRTLACSLVERGLLTQYQAERIQAGTNLGLVLGNYRVLERIGAGGMGIVFMAEHVHLRRQVALKVLPLSSGADTGLLRRFIAEMRAVAHLNHPNIVGALDAGKHVAAGHDQVLFYFVMEYVPGQDLEERVRKSGPLAVAQACDAVYQIAAALIETSRHGLVHRDIKPSNVRLTPEGQAKLLDFGLARVPTVPSHRLTQPGTMLGTVDYVAPEQMFDASSVDVRADIYSLGGTLFWCLTGQSPVQAAGSVVESIVARREQPPPSLRTRCPDAPRELEAMVARMMAPRPDDRFATPQQLLQALAPFLKRQLRDHVSRSEDLHGIHRIAVGWSEQASTSRQEILIVDDEAMVRTFCEFSLSRDEFSCAQALDGAQALEVIRARRFDLVLLDVHMPGLTGTDVCRELRCNPPYPHLKIIMMSGRATGDEMAQVLLAGADDFLTKPMSAVQLRARVKAALRLKSAQDRADGLNSSLLTLNQELERDLSARESDLIHARNALVLGLAELVAYRDSETGAHLHRLQRYCRTLAGEAANMPAFAGLIDDRFADMLECSAPLHDIGKVGLPDHILLKPGRLSADERALMETHTIMGAETLKKVMDRHGFARAFLQMAIDIARHHHERFDGRGYPDRLAGDDIPLSARIVAIADVYDALRSRRVYKPALSHETAVRMMLHEFTGQFDPCLLAVFERCAPQFARTFRELAS